MLLDTLAPASRPGRASRAPWRCPAVAAHQVPTDRACPTAFCARAYPGQENCPHPDSHRAAPAPDPELSGTPGYVLGLRPASGLYPGAPRANAAQRRLLFLEVTPAGRLRWRRQGDFQLRRSRRAGATFFDGPRPPPADWRQVRGQTRRIGASRHCPLWPGLAAAAPGSGVVAPRQADIRTTSPESDEHRAVHPEQGVSRPEAGWHAGGWD